jgi:hypothetical protein
MRAFGVLFGLRAASEEARVATLRGEVIVPLRAELIEDGSLCSEGFSWFAAFGGWGYNLPRFLLLFGGWMGKMGEQVR